MSVFETFYLLFKSDTTDLKKGSDEAINSTKKLKGEINSLDKATEKVGSNFARIITQLTGAVAAFASIHSVISGLANTVNYDIELGKTSRFLGVDPEDLDLWGRAAKQAGGTAEGFQNSLRNLAQNFHTTAKVAMGALPQLADVFSKISRYAAFNLGKAYGLDEGTILLLQQGRREVEAVLKKQRELGIITKEDTEISYKYNQALGNLETSFRTLYNAIIIPILPALTSFFGILEKGLAYLTDHKDLVIGAFVGIAASALSAAFAFDLLTLPIIGITLAVILLIGLFALLWEDTKVYFKGGKSLIGEYLDEWKKLGKTIDDIIDRWTKKFLDFLDKFSLLKPIADYIRNNDNTFSSFKKSDQGRGIDLILSSSATPLNNQTSNSHFYESAFNRNFSINSMPITINTQATDAEGIAKHIGLTWKDQTSLASNLFATNTHV